jgi:hypothetical protein
MDLSIQIEKGAVYNPTIHTGCYGKRIHIGYGARINGSIFGRDSVILESGNTKRKGSGLIYGSVTSESDIHIRMPESRMDDYEDGGILVVGDLHGRRISIEAPSIIMGNLVAKENITIKGRSLIFGAVYCEEGSIDLEQTSCYSIFAGNKKQIKRTDPSQATIGGSAEETETVFGLRIGAGVSVLTPIIRVKGNAKPMQIEAPIRVIDDFCFKCALDQEVEGETVGSFAFRCPAFLKECSNNYERLAKCDMMPYQGGHIISNAWRTYEENIGDDGNIENLLEAHLKERKDEIKYMKLFEQESLDSYVSIDQLLSNIQNVNPEE